eukprot:6198939-Pleurochrysis_carterae.AAC.2
MLAAVFAAVVVLAAVAVLAATGGWKLKPSCVAAPRTTVDSRTPQLAVQQHRRNCTHCHEQQRKYCLGTHYRAGSPGQTDSSDSRY